MCVCCQNAKGGFFSESVTHFSNLPIAQKKKFQKTILNLKFRMNNTSMAGFEKRIALSEKSHL